MHVLVVAAWPPWPTTDGARLVLARQLRELGTRHEITVLAAARDWLEPPAGEDDLPADVRLFGPRGRLGPYVRGRVRGLLEAEPLEVHQVLDPELVRAMDSHVRDRGPDVVHLYGWGTAPLARRARAPGVVHSPLDAWSLGVRNRRRRRWRDLVEADQPWLVRRHERRHYPACDAVVVVAERDAEHLRRLVPGTRIEVVPNGVDPGAQSSPITDEPVIGFHGVLTTRANEDAARVLIDDVLPLVRRRRPDATATIAGPGAPAWLRGRDGAAVAVRGEVPDIRTWFDDVAVYVAPLVSGTGIKNKVLEAMAAGRPAVVTRLALSGIGAGDGVVVADTPAAMAEAAVGLLADADARRRIGAAGRNRVCRDFGWDRAAAAIEHLWDEVAR